MAPKILVVDDEVNILRLLQVNLEKEGFEVILATNGNEALERVRQCRPDLVILDLMLPGIDGLEVAKRLRREDIWIPILILTARSSEVDKVVGLEVGADDYLTKPFSVRELVARTRALLRRASLADRNMDKGKVTVGSIVLDPERHEVYVGDQLVELTPTEFALLELLMRNPGRVYTREMLLDRIWGYDYTGDTRIVDVHVSHLRDKIESIAKDGRYIITVRGLGYKFREM
ncbi:MAG TPA: response regulator transcription factor [Firmicutes bacterium]|nr:response regulator transcription factor [Bacillota bacterium]